jgi:2-dehydro-3-deoxyphosphogluconate aldolase/(4S)-4-hydroxy-2-oxoglutarate aldolase
LHTVKVFPAGVVGGIPALKAFGSVFRSMKFMPTGGVSAANLADYLEIPSVLACGGSWLAPTTLTGAGDFDAITARAAEAIAIASQFRD